MASARSKAARLLCTPRIGEVSVADGFWGRWTEIHLEKALDHQWRELVATGALENFEYAAGTAEGPYRSNFASDSDVYKWVDAASRALAIRPDPIIEARISTVAGLVEAAQDSDGYVATWIQAQFPQSRFVNLELEHELYCMGHLIEAGVSHFEATGSTRILALGERAADLLVAEFMGAGAAKLDGHPGVEIGLMRLYRCTGKNDYLELAKRMIDRRGTGKHFASHFLRSLARTAEHFVKSGMNRRRAARGSAGELGTRREARRELRVRASAVGRVIRESLSGRTFQLQEPVRSLAGPVGHAVRFMYLQTAVAMLARETGDESLREASERSWQRFVEAHMFVSGGAGAMPLLEGFGDDYDLNPDTAYAETCAAIGGCMWTREMGLLTGEAAFDDLYEWQLLNAAGVGMSPEGDSYFYDNPLRSSGGIQRRSWFPIPCCPPNLSRHWLSLGTSQFSWGKGELRVHQYFSGNASLDVGSVSMRSSLPWEGRVSIDFEPDSAEAEIERLLLRIPWWAGESSVRVDGGALVTVSQDAHYAKRSATGFNPTRSRWQEIRLQGAKTVNIKVEFEMPVRFLKQDERIPLVGGSVALARGPLLYCIEGHDNGGDIRDVGIGSEVTSRFDAGLLGGATVLECESDSGNPLIFVPYFLWANRGAGAMSPFVRSSVEECRTGGVML